MILGPPSQKSPNVLIHKVIALRFILTLNIALLCSVV